MTFKVGNTVRIKEGTEAVPEPLETGKGYTIAGFEPSTDWIFLAGAENYFFAEEELDLVELAPLGGQLGIESDDYSDFTGTVAPAVGRAILRSKDGDSVLYGTMLYWDDTEGPESEFGFRIDGCATENFLDATDWEIEYVKEPVKLPTGKYAVVDVDGDVFVRDEREDFWRFMSTGTAYTTSDLLDLVADDILITVIFEGVKE